MRLWCRCSGTDIDYAVPADLSLAGRKTEGFFVIGGGKWAYVADGNVREWQRNPRGDRLQVITLSATRCWKRKNSGEKRIIVRLTMQHAARYAYIAKVLNDLAAGGPSAFTTTSRNRCARKCGGPLVPGTRHCRQCVSKTEALLKLIGAAKGYWRPLLLAFALLIMGSAFPSWSLF